MIGFYLLIAGVLITAAIIAMWDLYFGICLVLIAALLIFSFLDVFKDFRKENELGANTIVTLIATLVGVYLAVSVANWQDARKESTRKEEEAKQMRDRHVGVLEAIKHDFYLASQGLKDYDRGYLQHYKPVEGQSLKAAGQKIVLTPDLFGEYLKQEFILTQIYPKMINNFLSLHRNAHNAYVDINNTELKTVDDFKLRKEVALMHTQMFMWYVDLQIGYLKKELSEEDIKRRMIEIDQWFKETFINIQKKYSQRMTVIRLSPPDSDLKPKR